MTQQYMGQIPDPAQESGTDLAARLNAFDNAHRTNQSGPTRPANILAGGIWTRVVGGVFDLMVFDGAQDRIVMRVDGNLAGIPNLEAARNNLGLKALATKDKAAIVNDTTGTLPVNRGGTGGTTEAAARSGLGFTLVAGALSRLNESVNHIDSSWVAGVSTIPGFASPKQIADAIAAMALGVGQDWVDVKGARVKNTSYQNTTGKPILVVVRATRLALGLDSQVSVDGVNWLTVMFSGGGDRYGQYTIVPPGRYFRFTGDFEMWMELR